MTTDTKNMMKKFGIQPVKSLGQNFLVDQDVIDCIISTSGAGKEDLVIEIGPGTGAITKGLAEKAGFVAAVELDRKLLPVLKESLKEYSNVMIINKDILKVDIIKDIIQSPELTSSGVKFSSVKIVANLPYYITTPIIMQLLEQAYAIEAMVFMVQDEVAGRMTANPGGKDYGVLSLAVRYYAKAAKVRDVPPSSFTPMPEVNSAIIRLDVYREPPVNADSPELLFKTIRAAFGQRRKTLVNALTNSGLTGAGKQRVLELIQEMGLGEKQRGETLTLEQFADMSNKIKMMQILHKEEKTLSND